MCSSKMVTVDLWTNRLQGQKNEGGAGGLNLPCRNYNYSPSLLVLADYNPSCKKICQKTSRDLLVQTDELGVGVDWIQGSIDHVH